MKVIVQVPEKELRKLPFHILKKLDNWTSFVEEVGILQVRKIPGFHDEPLQGTRFGQRSVRLNRSYRAIYKMDKSNATVIVVVIEVTNHAY